MCIGGTRDGLDPEVVSDPQDRVRCGPWGGGGTRRENVARKEDLLHGAEAAPNEVTFEVLQTGNCTP